MNEEIAEMVRVNNGFWKRVTHFFCDKEIGFWSKPKGKSWTNIVVVNSWHGKVKEVRINGIKYYSE